MQIFSLLQFEKNFLSSHIVSVLLKTVLILCKYFLSFTSSLYRLQTDSVLCKYFLQFEKTFCFHIEFLSVEIFPVFYKWLISNVKVLYCANIAKGIFRLQKFSLVFRTANFAQFRTLTAQCCLCAKTQSVAKFYSVSKPCVFCQAKHRQNAFCR